MIEKCRQDIREAITADPLMPVAQIYEAKYSGITMQCTVISTAVYCTQYSSVLYSVRKCTVLGTQVYCNQYSSILYSAIRDGLPTNGEIYVQVSYKGEEGDSDYFF